MLICSSHSVIRTFVLPFFPHYVKCFSFFHNKIFVMNFKCCSTDNFIIRAFVFVVTAAYTS